MAVHLKKKSTRLEQELQHQNQELQLRLAEAEETLRAIREGEVDAVIVSGSRGEQVFSLVGTDSIYRLIVETMKEAALTVSFDGTILFCNAQFSEFIKQPMERILGRQLRKFIEPEDSEAAFGLLAAARSRPVKQRLVFRDANGGAMPAHVSANVLEQLHGPSICVVATDLTDLENSTKLIQQLRSQQQELNQQRRNLESILKHLPSGIVIAKAPSGKIILRNDRVMEIWKQEDLPSENIERSDLFKGFHPDGRPYLPEEWPLARTIELGERVQQEELRIQRGDGSFGWIAVNSAPIVDTDGRIVMGIVAFSDISRRKQAEEELRRLNEELEKRISERTAEIQHLADRLRALASQLSRTEQTERRRLAKVLHDHIQQLLVAAQMQLEYAGYAEEIGQAEAQKAVQAAGAILTEAMEASRSLAIDLYPPVLHENGLISALKWLADRMRSNHRLSVKFRAQKDGEPISEEIRFLLFECARELLLNAVKHANTEDAELALVRTEGNRIKLHVRDAGDGFNVESIRERSSAKATFGLFNIQQRLADIDGEMEIQSAPGKGTTINLTVPDAGERLPAAQMNENTQKQATAETAGVRGELNACRVLIVDDHAIVREGLVRIFGNNPDILVVGEASDGLQAIELAERLKPDVILMDVSMHGMSGIEATYQILKNNPDIKIVGLSALNDEQLAIAMRSAGATAYLDKAGNPDALINTIRSCARGA